MLKTGWNALPNRSSASVGEDGVVKGAVAEVTVSNEIGAEKHAHVTEA